MTDGRRSITPAQRFGVWKAWRGRCFWCKEPVVFKNCQIDHALPLTAAEAVGGMENLREMYKLPSDFELDSFDNWIPACAGCNLFKQSRLIEASPASLLALSGARAWGHWAQTISEGIEKDARKAPLLAKLEQAITAGDITQIEIENFLAGLPTMMRRSAVLPDDVLLITPHWQVVVAGHDESIFTVALQGSP